MPPKLIPKAEVTFDVPRTVNGVTDEFITNSLQHYNVIDNETKVSIVDKNPIGKGTGNCGDLLIMELAYEPKNSDLPKKIVGKFCPEVIPIGMPKRTWRDGALNEINNYTIVGTDTVPHPKFYAGVGNSAKDAFVVLMEYVDDLEGTDILQPLAVDRCERALKAVAKLHAKFWGGPKRLGGPVPTLGSPELDQAVPFLGDYRGIMKMMMSENCLMHPISDIQKILPPNVALRMADWPSIVSAKAGNTLNTYAPAMPKTGEPLYAVNPISIVFFDYRSDNIFISQNAPSDSNDLGVKAVDFAACMWAHPMVDVNYLMMTSLDPEELYQNKDRLIESYRQSLIENLTLFSNAASVDMSRDDNEIKIGKNPAPVPSLKTMQNDLWMQFMWTPMFVWSQLAPVMMARRKMLGEDAVNDRQIKAFQVVMERAITVMEKYNWADYMKQQPGSAPTCQYCCPCC